MKIRTQTYSLLAIAALVMLPGTALAGAVYFPEMSSASEAGYAGAGMVARANDAGTAFSNPAGMTRFDEPDMLAGAIGVYIEANFKPDRDNTTVDGKDGKINRKVVPAGTLAYVKPLSDRLSLGFKESGGVNGKYSRVSISVLSFYARWH